MLSLDTSALPALFACTVLFGGVALAVPTTRQAVLGIAQGRLPLLDARGQLPIAAIPQGRGSSLDADTLQGRRPSDFLPVTAAVSTAITVKVTLINLSGGAVELASGTLRADVWQP